MNEIFNYIDSYYGYQQETNRRVEAMWNEHQKVRFELAGIKSTMDSIRAIVEDAAKTIGGIKVSQEIVESLDRAMLFAHKATNNMKHLQDALKDSRNTVLLSERNAKRWIGLPIKDFRKLVDDGSVKQYEVNGRKYYLKAEILNALAENEKQIQQ